MSLTNSRYDISCIVTSWGAEPHNAITRGSLGILSLPLLNTKNFKKFKKF
jgi:hypothetical protein